MSSKLEKELQAHRVEAEEDAKRRFPAASSIVISFWGLDTIVDVHDESGYHRYAWEPEDD